MVRKFEKIWIRSLANEDINQRNLKILAENFGEGVDFRRCSEGNPHRASVVRDLMHEEILIH